MVTMKPRQAAWNEARRRDEEDRALGLADQHGASKRSRAGNIALAARGLEAEYRVAEHLGLPDWSPGGLLDKDAPDVGEYDVQCTSNGWGLWGDKPMRRHPDRKVILVSFETGRPVGWAYGREILDPANWTTSCPVPNFNLPRERLHAMEEL